MNVEFGCTRGDGVRVWFTAWVIRGRLVLVCENFRISFIVLHVPSDILDSSRREKKFYDNKNNYKENK